MIKAWIKTDSERGLQRAVMLLRSLALNGRHQMKMKNDDVTTNEPEKRDVNDEEVPTVFKRIARWGASLLGNDKANDREENDVGSNDKRHQNKSSHLAQSSYGSKQGNVSRQIPSKGNMNMSPSNRANRSNSQRQQQQILTGVGMTSRLNYLYSAATVQSKGNNARIVNKNKAKPKTERPYGDDIQTLLAMQAMQLQSYSHTIVLSQPARNA